MRKLILAIAGTLVSGSAAAALAMGASHADPGNGGNLLNVVGEPYAKAVAILRAQGVPTVFGGSIGSDVPQAQCIVKSEKVLATRQMQLNLDCTAAAQPEAPAGPAISAGTGTGAQPTEGGRPTPGATTIVTVIPTRVG